jgi:UDP-3-O-[3-hydroxymyristoyl] glucosamine N-acyltransferase
VTFFGDTKRRAELDRTRAAAVIVASAEQDTVKSLGRSALVVRDAYVGYARAAALLHPRPKPAPGVHPSAHVHPSAFVSPDASIGAAVIIGENVRVGSRVVLHPHVVLYREVSVGAGSELHSGVAVREGCAIGERVLIHNNAVIGADGFGFAKDPSGGYVKIPQVGTVVIEDDVEIGALCAIDRASMGETRVRRGTKIDNLVQIGHSVSIGEDSVLCAQVGVAGSTTIGARATLAGQVGVADHVTIGDDVIASAQSGVHGRVESGSRVSGTPAIDGRVWLRASAAIKQLPDLVRRIRELEARTATKDQG